MKAGRQDVRQHRQICNFGHSLRFVRELDQVEIRVRNEDKFSLAADPSAHVDIAIGSAGAPRIDVKTDSGFLFPAGAASSAGNVEGNRNQVALLDEFDIHASFDHLAGNLVS